MSESSITISVFTENHPGLLHRVTSVFTRRNINIESLTVSPSEVPGLHRFTIVVNIPLDQANRIALQIEKQIDVLKAFVHEQHEVVHRDLALYKMAASAWESDAFRELLFVHDVQVLEQQPDYTVLEKTGSQADTTALLALLEPFGVLEFVRSGNVALTRPMRTLSEFIADIEALQKLAGQSPLIETPPIQE
jgi:acetolactate synthase-1/3 small subunit